MSNKDLLIAVALMLLCAFGLKPSFNNFRIVLKDKNNPRASPAMRRFVLFWLGLGVFALVFVFFAIAYSMAARFGLVPDFEF